MRTRSEINSTEWFGHIPNGWEMRPIKALFRFSKGLSITKADLSECGAPVISYGQIHSKDYDGTGITESLIRYVPKSIAQSSNSSYVKHGGFIFADTSEDLAGVGNCAYNDGNEDLFGGYHTIVANPLLSSENKYFAYLFRTDAWRKQLRKQLVDVKLFSVNQSILGESYVAVPPLDVQRSIVAFLDSRCKPINEAIARHRIIIDKLEDYRKAVITKTVTKGLNDNIPMKDVGIGRVKNMPANWSVTKVKFIAKVIPGATPKSTISAFWNGDIPFVTPADYITEDHYIEHWARTITEEGMNSCSTSVLPPNSVIVSNRAPIGLVAINKVPVCTNQGCKGLVVKSREYSPEYLYRLLSVADDALNALGNGTTYPELSGKALSDFVIQKPPLDVQRSIVAFLDSQCESINKAIASHRVIIDKLEEYRRGLIFHAVTGRIDCTGGAR